MDVEASKIESVNATAVAVPLAVKTSMSTRTVTERHYVLVRIRSTDGVEGIGYTYAGTIGGRYVRDAVNEFLAPIVLRQSRWDIENLWAAMYQELLLIGRRGALLRAMSAVDIALHDAAAKSSGVSLSRFLGGDRNLIPVYASGGYYRDDDPLRSVANEILHNKDQGFRDHKIKVGGLSVNEDAERVRVACEHLDDGERLALDANNAYKTAADAVVAIRAFERAASKHGHLWWFEEPLAPDDIQGHALIAAKVETPVATGEIHQTRWDFRYLLEKNGISILQHDAAVVGGISEWRKISALASAFGAQIAPHWHANLHVHLAAATPDCLVVEHFDLGKDIFNFERLLTEESRLSPANGVVRVPDAPGLGIEFDEKAVRKYG